MRTRLARPRHLLPPAPLLSCRGLSGLNVAASLLPQRVRTDTPVCDASPWPLPRPGPRPAPPDSARVSCCHRAPGHPGSAPRAFAFLTARGHPLTRRRFGYLFPYPLPSSNPRPARAGAAAVWLADQQEPRSGRRATDPRRSNGVTGSHMWPRSLHRLLRPGRSAYGAGRMSPSGRNGFANSVAQSAFRPRLQRIDLIF